MRQLRLTVLQPQRQMNRFQLCLQTLRMQALRVLIEFFHFNPLPFLNVGIPCPDTCFLKVVSNSLFGHHRH